ncbi:hypothetical protein [Sedimentitalea todarodis]|uniref:Uncharacterized protein n=1 Tax=Sedimentitalea todarodis TaxID=1631240 RepID=A0ABU3VHR3_9RHOB|nr:hypothetical protein [Sedimentitalea todarodis]MDU9005712.1 hypothetical protein [Sedimentitalea todarodis]
MQKLTPGEVPEVLALVQWKDEVDNPGDAFERACLRGLLAIVGGIVGRPAQVQQLNA